MSFDAFCQAICVPEGTPVTIDYSRMGLDPAGLARLEPKIQKAFDDMVALEAGAIANPDENRMVGHYWLRDLELIPSNTLRDEVKADDAAMRALIASVVEGRLLSPAGKPFRNLLSIGIGGSALGPQFIADALGRDGGDKLRPYFLDNTDPEGIARILEQLKGQLGETLALVISKSGGTPETRNGMLLAEAAYRRAGLSFGPHAVAITGRGSKLDQYAQQNGWIARLPMYDWVGGRTSVMSSVGLVPMGLQGINFDGVLAGARAMDVATRNRVTRENPAAILAACWYHATNGRGEKDMVVLPYKDRLLLFSRYLQQLVMESLGKELDLDGNRVEQGISVYGNKGSTDQHAYVQQLRDGVNNFFAVFIEVLSDGGDALEVEPGITSGDYLSGFYLGTRTALSDKGRQNLTITIDAVTPETVGALIALFERAVSFYATMVHINAYHQPGVEAGKKAASVVLSSQAKLVAALAAGGGARTAPELAAAAGVDPEQAFHILRHLAHNGRARMEGRHPSTARFSKA
jgi:glucose-6-phosphate isomerase